MNKKNKPQRVRNTRRLRFGTTSTVLTVVVIAAVVLLNVLVGIVADKFPVTWDLSSDKVFTLSNESVEIAKGVTKDVEIVLFLAEEELTNPTLGSAFNVEELNTCMKELYTALQQYSNHSGEKVTFKFINPDQEPTKYAAYSDYEVEAGDILFISGERHRVCTIYDLNNFVSDIYPELYSYGYYNTSFESKVEQVLASNIHALQSEKDRVVQVLVGHSEDSNTIAGLKTLYELNGFTFKENTITGSAEFDENAEVMLIAAPTTDYSNAEIQRVQEWVYNDGNYGRHLMVFVSPTANCPNLYELLDVQYGIQVTDELLLETDYNRMYYYTPTFPFGDIPTTDYTGKSASTGKLCTPTARRLTTSLASAPEQEDAAIYDIGVPLTNYPESAQLIKLEDYSKENVEGVYKADNAEYPLTSMIACVKKGYNNNIYEDTYGTIVVSGCPAMAYSEYVQYAAFSNEDLLLDVVNSVTGYENSITISNKVLTTDTVTFDGGVQLWVGLGLFTIGIPVVLLVVCLVVFLRRKNL